MTESTKKGERAMRETRNRGLEQEQERLRDPEHLTPEEEGENPDPAAQEKAGQKRSVSKDHLKNPPQTTGPREDTNDMT